jgi:hypothetical protein
MELRLGAHSGPPEATRLGALSAHDPLSLQPSWTVAKGGVLSSGSSKQRRALDTGGPAPYPKFNRTLP